MPLIIFCAMPPAALYQVNTVSPLFVMFHTNKKASCNGTSFPLQLAFICQTVTYTNRNIVLCIP